MRARQSRSAHAPPHMLAHSRAHALPMTVAPRCTACASLARSVALATRSSRSSYGGKDDACTRPARSTIRSVCGRESSSEMPAGTRDSKPCPSVGRCLEQLPMCEGSGCADAGARE